GGNEPGGRLSCAEAWHIGHLSQAQPSQVTVGSNTSRGRGRLLDGPQDDASRNAKWRCKIQPPNRASYTAREASSALRLRGSREQGDGTPARGFPKFREGHS